MLAQVARKALELGGQVQPQLQTARGWKCNVPLRVASLDGNAVCSVSPARCAGSSFTCADRIAIQASSPRGICVVSYFFDSRLQTITQHIAAVHAGVLLGHGVDQRLGNFQRAPYIAQRTAGPVADHRGGNGSTLSPVFFVDVLDDLLAALVLEVHVNVRWLIALSGDKTLKQE